jgi:Zn-dependent protease
MSEHETRPEQAAEPRGAIRLGSVRGVPIYLNGYWFLLAGLIIITYGQILDRPSSGFSAGTAYVVAAAFVVCLLLSVLLHELGHALTARRFGIRVRAITLDMLGGYTEMEADSPNARADLLVSLAGPVVSAVLGLGALGAAVVLPDGVANELAGQLAFSNIIVAIFNSLPGLPLDGGRVLRAGVWAVTGDQNLGSRVAGWVGRVVAVGAVLAVALAYRSGYVGLVGLIFTFVVALTMWQGATAAIRHGRVAARVPSIDLRKLVRPVFVVSAGTPLSEAARRVVEAGMSGADVAVTDSSGRLIALVAEQAAAAVPPERRPWVPVDSVARTLDPGRTLAADLAGDEVLRAVRTHPAETYLVVSGETVVGVLHTADLARALTAR